LHIDKALGNFFSPKSDNTTFVALRGPFRVRQIQNASSQKNAADAVFVFYQKSVCTVTCALAAAVCRSARRRQSSYLNQMSRKSMLNELWCRWWR